MDNYERKELAEKILKTMPQFFDRLIARRGPRTGPGHVHLLFLLRDNPGIIMTDLSRQLNIPKPNLTVVVDKLVREGLVRREPSERDRRVILLRLTEKGNEQANLRRRFMLEDTFNGLKRISDEDARDLERYVDGIARIIEKLAKE